MNTSRLSAHPARTALAALLFFAIGAGIAGAKVTHPAVTPDAGIDLHGTILDETGAPVAGVVVSDGFQCVATDERGVYQMKRHPKARVVYYSTPAEFAINTRGKPGKGGSSALFYEKLNKRAQRHDFDLVRLPAPERHVNIVCVGDPQVRNETELERYKNETIFDLYKFAKASRLPCYAVLLGDVGFDTMHMHLPMRETTGFSEVPYFAVIGNHDHNMGIRDDYKSGEGFESVFGPLNFSFNRAGVHIIGMDDILYEGGGNYKGGFTDEQVEWLRQDLSFVPKDKIIVLAYHIPLRENASYKNREAVLNLFKGYAGVHLMSAHTHTHENFIVTKPLDTYEHIHGTACGAWWASNLNTDGAPNGFACYVFSGNKLVDWYYKATGHDRAFQMRMYRGNARFGSLGNSFTYKQTANDVVVAVWNADPAWKIVAYENGVEAGALQKLPTMLDAYATGYHVGKLGRESKDNRGMNKHLYMHTLKDPAARVEIRATDRFGKTYTLTEFTTDLSAAGGGVAKKRAK